MNASLLDTLAARGGATRRSAGSAAESREVCIASILIRGFPRVERRHGPDGRCVRARFVAVPEFPDLHVVRCARVATWCMLRVGPVPWRSGRDRDAAADRQGRLARRGEIPRDRPAVQLAGVRAGVLLQARSADGATTEQRCAVWWRAPGAGIRWSPARGRSRPSSLAPGRSRRGRA
jgi:hypothetical protein